MISNRNLSTNQLLYIFTAFLFFLCGSQGVVFGLSQDDTNSIYNNSVWYKAGSATTQSGSCVIAGNGTLPSVVPAPYNAIFTAAGNKFNVPPAFLAALFYAGEHGSSWPNPPPQYGTGSPWADSHVTGSNAPWPNGEHDGAAGPFQFEFPAWTSYGVDGNGDGQKDVEDLTDASFGAANYLANLGANTTVTAKLHDAAYHYNGSGDAATIYADKVMEAYQLFSGGSPPATTTGSAITPPTSDCPGSISIGSVSIIQNGAFGLADGLMGHRPTMIGVHYTAGSEQTVQDVISSLGDPTGSKHCNRSCSVQLTVDPKGNVYQLTSRLDVITENIINFNDADIGIEIMGNNEQTLLSNQVQYKAVVSLVAQLMQQYNIKVEEGFNSKAGLMGHMECDSWSQGHLGQSFSGIYSGETVNSTDSHSDPGATYMSNLRAAVGQQGL